MTTYPNPGFVADVITIAGKCESTWAQAIRDRTVQNFASAAARDAAIPTPVVGQACVCIVSGMPKFLIYQGPTTLWTPPWNEAWGIQGTPISDSANHGGITAVADVPGASITWVAVANRLYEVTVSAEILNTGSGNSCQLQVTDASNAIQANANVHSGGASVNDSLTFSYLEWVAAGSTTRKLRALAGAGTMAVEGTTSPTQFYIKDIGPHGNPS